MTTNADAVDARICSGEHVAEAKVLVSPVLW